MQARVDPKVELAHLIKEDRSAPCMTTSVCLHSYQQHNILVPRAWVQPLLRSADEAVQACWCSFWAAQHA